MTSETEKPLSGLRVLDIATFIAAPFCGSTLAEFGAEVIKIEQPGIGDPLRYWGTTTDCGDSLVWLSEARNKKSVTLDLRLQAGKEIFRKLVEKSDVVLENFRPGTLEKWGLGFEDLSKINPRLVMLRVSAYGQTGPYKDKPGYARIAHAFSGLSHLAREPGAKPVMPGSTSLADYFSGLYGAVGVLLALRSLEKSGRGQFIDIGLYESVFRIMDELVPSYGRNKFVRQPMGADTVNIVPHSHYRTADDRWVAIACSSDRMFERLAVTMGRPELAQDVRYKTMGERDKRRDELNKMVGDWAASYAAKDVLDLCEANEMACGLLYDIEDIFNDPQYKARGNIKQMADERVGDFHAPNVVPRLSATPGSLDTLGPALGAHTEEVLSDLLSMTAGDFESLRKAKVI
ncbi:CaiB/BaiF CoA transferase family protein [Hydrogenophaga sp. BPS33]|uniref:CaiB/BaiF CoA transferase family protein n=1 Tax=Hydrogenophaga sp. BPS33 TaxID=2651974 RepID=UPI00131FB04B|nr:CoA transferase [Hydrogenophaga sp. BPS33]QHE83398.1 CoA transferase [Hydrogenophaga sp. BPS33]